MSSDPKGPLGYCLFCGKRPRGRMAERNFERYSPYCSFDHQERHKLIKARMYLNELKEARSE